MRAEQRSLARWRGRAWFVTALAIGFAAGAAAEGQWRRAHQMRSSATQGRDRKDDQSRTRFRVVQR
jgi:hypothetical protein